MATYVMGDLQGCFIEFQRLMDLIQFDSTQDKLWLVGDIVNRGPDSLSLLRYIKQAGDLVTIVLGNHDLHLLMVATGIAKINPKDTLWPILNAPDRDELLHWLRQQKLLHTEGQYVMVHAGLLPSWSIAQAEELAREAENALCQERDQELLASIYSNEPNYWDDEWTGGVRLGVIINAMTRMRICSADGKMNLTFKGNLQSIPMGYLPWFRLPQRASQHHIIICGHWSALGLYLTDNLIALDSGCVWGRKLTAIRLEDLKIFQLSCAE